MAYRIIGQQERSTGGRGGNQNDRIQSINQQEKLLAAKKKEILQKLEEKKKRQLAEEEAKLMSLAASSIPLPVPPPVRKEATPPPPKPQAAGLNTFNNDGSFMEQFRKMQEAARKQEQSLISIANAPPPPPPPDPYEAPPASTYHQPPGPPIHHPPPAASPIHHQHPPPPIHHPPPAPPIRHQHPPPPIHHPPPAHPIHHPPPGPPIHHQPPPPPIHHQHPVAPPIHHQPPVPNMYSKMKQVAPPIRLSKPTVFQDSDSDDEQDSHGNKDPEMRQIIETFARSVADGGVVIEEIATKNHRGNPNYRFLMDTSSKLHAYYKQKVGEYRIENQQIFADKTVAWLSTKDNPAPPSSSSFGETESRGKRKRKSRWGSSEMNPDIAAPKVAAPNLGVAAAMNPFGMVGTSELSEDQKKQFIEQKQMQAMYDAVISRQRQLMQEQEHHEELKRQYAYDSDEDTAGGTWEHKLRSKEMRQTQEYAEKLTSLGRGKHHMGDFLPPEELNKFMETLNALKEGRTPDYSDYKEFKLQADNIGFQMLQKLGWKEGQGLGSEAQGITAPVNRAAQRSDNQGLGIERPADLTKEDADNEYDAYRKRMMLAYRFRPNPLNNPRRPYY